MKIKDNTLISVEGTDIINGKFIVPKEVIRIGDNVFENRSNLEEIDTSNVEVIGVGAFRDCKNLKKVNMPHLKDIWNSAFSNCTSLPCPNNKIRAEICELALKYLNEDMSMGLCYYLNMAITDAIIKYKQAICLQTCFPLFTYQNAKEKFRATGWKYDFWRPMENKEIRKKFLKWCFENKK